jgi:hypothetical protein
VSVHNTRLDGMVDHIVLAASHPRLPENAIAIRQTVAFLKDGTFSFAGWRECALEIPPAS